jgi:hypothetical protein
MCNYAGRRKWEPGSLSLCLSSYDFLTFYATTYHDSNITAIEIVDNRLVFIQVLCQKILCSQGSSIGIVLIHQYYVNWLSSNWFLFLMRNSLLFLGYLLIAERVCGCCLVITPCDGSWFWMFINFQRTGEEYEYPSGTYRYVLTPFASSFDDSLLLIYLCSSFDNS